MTILISTIFVLGYLAIAFEHSIKVNKAAAALITGVLCWTTYILFTPDKDFVSEQLMLHMGDLSGILFFLLGAMTIVELIDAHEGFEIITSRIQQTNKVKLLWIVSIFTFFLSSILDNLTTTIVMVSLLRKLIKDDKDRLFYTSLVVIAANAGGAWTPIGDVTTTMLWIGGQITTANIMMKLFLPSIICLVVPLAFLSFKLKGDVGRPNQKSVSKSQLLSQRHQSIIFSSGVLVLILVPVFKTLTHLPPYMGILLGLGILWIITEVIHRKKEAEARHSFSVVQALRKIEFSSILFFLGILVSIAALESIGLLSQAANWMTVNMHSEANIAISLGLLSSIIDNVPLVAAVQGMFDLSQYPTDHYFWEFLSYTAGTGGSCLIIGSAAGVAAMGMEKISFFWYMKKITFWALLGYFAGAFMYILQHKLLGL